MKRERTESVPRTVVYATVCDNCGKTGEGADPEGWHHFTSHHGDWGSDSGESFANHDVCSWPCYLAIVSTVFATYGGDDGGTLEIDDKDWSFISSMLEAHKHEAIER